MRIGGGSVPVAPWAARRDGKNPQQEQGFSHAAILRPWRAPSQLPEAVSAPEMSVVVTVFNEAASLEELYRRATAALAGRDYELIFVDDGSSDGSFDIVERLYAADARVRGVKLKRNFGQHPAMHAGLVRARGDDRRDDGQRPPEPARGPAEADRRGRVGLRRRERPAHRPARLVGPDAAVADDQRDAPPLHRRGDLRLRLRVQRLPARGGRAGARRDRQAEVHEGARPLDRSERRRGGRRPRGARRQVPLFAAPARAHRAAACSPASGRSRSSGSASHSA